MAIQLGTVTSLTISCKNAGASIINEGDAVFTLHTKEIDRAGGIFVNIDIVTEDSIADANAFLGVARERAYVGDYLEVAYVGLVMAKVKTTIIGKELIVPGTGADGMFGEIKIGAVEDPVVGFAFDPGTWTTATRSLSLIYLNGLTRSAVGL